MATWITHMRVAENFMKQYKQLDCVEFLVGNIAPDCGVPIDDGSRFLPDSKETHWNPSGVSIDAEGFRKTYVSRDSSKYQFYLGYYFHLLTDIAWNGFYKKKVLEPSFCEELRENPRIIHKFKQDCYNQDKAFLEKNPEFVFFQAFQHIDAFDNDYLVFFSRDAIITKIHFITEFYRHIGEHTNNEFLYLSKDEMDNFVEDTITAIDAKFKEADLVT